LITESASGRVTGANLIQISMIVLRKDRETNQQVLRRFNRLLQAHSKLKKVRDKQYFAKEPNRFARKVAAVRKTQLRDERQWY
jgi:ribosomal protein S21